MRTTFALVEGFVARFVTLLDPPQELRCRGAYASAGLADRLSSDDAGRHA